MRVLRLFLVRRARRLKEGLVMRGFNRVRGCLEREGFAVSGAAESSR